MIVLNISEPPNCVVIILHEDVTVVFEYLSV
jgi:hypothetical protein